MMKQKTFSILSLLLALCLCLCACGEEEAPTTPSAVCTHNWMLATCQAPKTCTLCGVTEGEIGIHNYKSVDYLPATCTSHGIQVYECTVCANRQTKSIAAIGHIPIGGICAVCDASVDGDVKNIILVIGDGMGLGHITAGEAAFSEQFIFTDWQSISVNTDSLNASKEAVSLTDSAAAATAMATGTLTQNGRVAADSDGAACKTILDIAKEVGKRTGIVTTDYLYGATPAAFSAHALDRNDTSTILSSQLTSGIDLLCGAASTTALPEAEITSAAYTYCSDLASARTNLSADRLYCTLKMEGYTDISDSPTFLCDAVQFAMEYLNNEQGYVLIVEQAHIDKFSHANDISGVVSSVNSIHKTVKVITEQIGMQNDTAIFLTSDHESGGLAVSQDQLLAHAYMAENGIAFYYQFTSDNHTNQNVMLFLYGVHFDYSALPYYHSDLQIKNTDIFVMMKQLIENNE